MHTQASAYLSYADQLPHKIRLFSFQLGKFVDDDKKMRYGNRGFAVFVKGSVEVDVIHTVFVEDSLAAHIFTFDGHHGPVDLSAGEIGYLSQHMRQSLKQVRHPAAFIVDDEQAHIVGTEVQCQGQDIGLQSFRFA